MAAYPRKRTPALEERLLVGEPEQRYEIVGEWHWLEGAYVGATGVAERVAAGGGTRSRGQDAEHLADQFSTVPVPHSVSKHVRVRADVGQGEGLAEDVRSLEMVPLVARALVDTGERGSLKLGSPGISQP